ncbi:hypothetical protein Pen01_38100 [Phytomonospora endophytica]|nr:hypothetical protein Pen01_38100 [Phytomonospora endophytica]
MAGAVVFGLAVVGTVVHEEASAAPPGSACLTWRDPVSGAHKLSTVDHGDGARVTVAALPYRVNAVGFAPRQEMLYGLTPTRGGGSGADLIRIDRKGQTRDLGRVKGGEDLRGFAGAYVGDVVGDRLLVLTDTELVSVGIDPAQTDEFASIVERVRISTHPRFGDWSYDSQTGLLYGLSSVGGGTLVSVDPDSGRVVLRPVRGLPGKGFFAATFIAPGRVLYAVAGDIGGRAALYRLPLDGEPRASAVANWPALDSADAAYCPRPLVTPSPSPSTSKPSPSPSSPAPTTTVPPSSPPVSPSPPSPPAPPPPPPPPPGQEPPPDYDPPPPPPPLPRELAVPLPEAAPVEAGTFSNPHRRRAMVVGAVLMALSGSAGARSLRRR